MIQSLLRIAVAPLIAPLLFLPGGDLLGQRAPGKGAINEAAVESPLQRFPARILQRGSATLQIQILLDRANFSPGIIDGFWGENAAKALAFFVTPDDDEHLSGGTPARVPRIDRKAYERLRLAAGPEPLLERYTVTPDDLAGPFVDIPDQVYAQAKLDCLCYSSPAESLAERFHTSETLLAQLNPVVKLDRLTSGTVLIVPNVENTNAASPLDTVIVAKLIISRDGFWTHAIDNAGRIVYHMPSTLGAGYDPSPTGVFRITYIARDPAFRYQPKLFAEVPDDRPEALLAAGPNSPVGVVWMSLSKPHYGIHGTSSPETIGYANSHGCVRLTNWDALTLSSLVESGTRVEFHQSDSER